MDHAWPCQWSCRVGVSSTTTRCDSVSATMSSTTCCSSCTDSTTMKAPTLRVSVPCQWTTTTTTTWSSRWSMPRSRPWPNPSAYDDRAPAGTILLHHVTLSLCLWLIGSWCSCHQCFTMILMMMMLLLPSSSPSYRPWHYPPWCVG